MRKSYRTLTDSVFPAPLDYSGQQDFYSRCCLVPFSRNDNCLTNSLFPHSSIRILGNSKQVRLEIPSPSSAVRLNDLRTILGNALKRVHRNQNDATIGVDTMLRIAVPDGVENWAEIEGRMYYLDGQSAPEGSLRWDSVARSSAVSSKGGFRKGGRSSWPSLTALTVVSTRISWNERFEWGSGQRLRQ